MPGHMPLDVFPLGGLFLLASAVILLAHETGFRLGRARWAGENRENDGPVGGMVAAELGLLAFLLAFTFGMATSRFDSRREVLLDESNAVGTAFLRAAFLPAPHREQVRQSLREYVDLRIAAMQGTSMDHALRESEELHGRMWAETVAAAEKDPRSVPMGLFIEALNEVIDLHSKRVTAGLRSRIPMSVWGVLFSVAFLSFAAMGYQVGLAGARRSPAVFVVALTFAAVIWLVADLDRPGQGMLRVSQQPMIDLRNSMAVPSR